MKSCASVTAALFALTLVACEKIEEPVKNSAETKPLVSVSVETAIPSSEYRNDGLSFEFPANWSVVEDTLQDDIRYIFIESEDAALSMIQVFPKAQAPSLEDFAYSYAQQTQITPIPVEGESIDVQPTAAPQPEFMTIARDLDGTSYEWIVETAPSSVAGLNTSEYREYFRKDSETHSAFLINQVNNDALDKHEGSFELIFRTLQPTQ